MNRLIYINLFIDNEWDESKILDTVFSIKIPSSKAILDSYHSWAMLMGCSRDFALVKEKSDPHFIMFLKEHIDIAIEISFNELSDKVLKTINVFEFSGVSSDEEKIISMKPEIKGFLINKENYRRLNSKVILLKIAESAGFIFPKTDIIQIQDFDVLNESIKPFVLKFNQSAGGRGVFVINEEAAYLPGFIKRQLGEVEDTAVFLKQEFINIDQNFYTIANTENTDVIGFHVEYDQSNNSKVHRPENVIHPLRISVASEIADYLKMQNYHGPFGFDGFTAKDGSLYPAIDLNVRLDKSRLIYDLACKLSIKNRQYEFCRERFQSRGFENFKSFWLDRATGLEKINNNYNKAFSLFPVLFSNFFRESREIDTVEISFFCIHQSESFDVDGKYEDWKSELYEWLEIKN